MNKYFLLLYNLFVIALFYACFSIVKDAFGWKWAFVYSGTLIGINLRFGFTLYMIGKKFFGGMQILAVPETIPVVMATRGIRPGEVDADFKVKSEPEGLPLDDDEIEAHMGEPCQCDLLVKIRGKESIILKKGTFEIQHL